MAGDAYRKRLIGDYRRQVLKSGAGAAALVVELGDQYIAGKLTLVEFEAALVAAEQLGFRDASRRAVDHVKAVRESQGVDGELVEAEFNHEAALARARSTTDALERVHSGDLKRTIVETAAVWADRAAKSGARRTVAASAQASGRRWRRVPDGDPCAFCAMLATRGFLDTGYTSEETALFNAEGEKYHDNCGCAAVEIVGEWRPSKKEQEWIDLYESVAAPLREAGTTPTPDEMVRSMREQGRFNDSPSRTSPAWHARKLLEHLTEVEPSVTAAFTELAKRHSARLEGLEFRLKSEESLARKIQTEAADGVPLDEVARDISDALRYTIVSEEEAYTSTAQAVVEELSDRGWHARVKNYWRDPTNPYQGVNVALTDPAGDKIELQFHTDTSFKVKDGPLHKLYEEFRSSDTSVQRRGELGEEMHKISRTIPVPPDILDF